MIRNIKKTLQPKSGMQKSSFLQDSGYVDRVHTAYNSASFYPLSKESKVTEIRTINLNGVLISHVKRVKGCINNIHSFNGIYVDRVKS